MKIRNYQQDDFENILIFLNRNLEHDVINARLLHEKLNEDPAWDPECTFVSEDDYGAVTGFIQGVIRNIRGIKYGYIKLICVKENMRRTGIGTALYNALENRFKRMKADVVRFLDVPGNYFLPGIDPRYTPALGFASRLGFTLFDKTANLLVDLQKYSWDTTEYEKLLNEHDIHVKRVEQSDILPLMQLIDYQWPLWHNEVDTACKNNPCSVHVALKRREVKAFSAYNANNKGTAWFGPMGTHTDLRGQKIGGTLLFRCLKDMKAAGFEHSIIPWVGPVAFYSYYANAYVHRVFWRYEKKLNN